VPIADVSLKPNGYRLAALLAQTEGGANRGQHLAGLVNRGQVDKSRTFRGVGQLVSDSYRQSSLTSACRAEDGQHPHVSLAEQRQLLLTPLLAAEQGRGLPRQPPPPLNRRTHAAEV